MVLVQQSPSALPSQEVLMALRGSLMLRFATSQRLVKRSYWTDFLPSLG